MRESSLAMGFSPSWFGTWRRNHPDRFEALKTEEAGRRGLVEVDLTHLNSPGLNIDKIRQAIRLHVGGLSMRRASRAAGFGPTWLGSWKHKHPDEFKRLQAEAEAVAAFGEPIEQIDGRGQLQSVCIGGPVSADNPLVARYQELAQAIRDDGVEIFVDPEDIDRHNLYIKGSAFNEDWVVVKAYPRPLPVEETVLGLIAYSQARCRDSGADPFFADGKADERQAWIFRQYCAGCRIRAVCLESALGWEADFGVWGGLAPPARRRIRSARRQLGQKDARPTGPTPIV